MKKSIFSLATVMILSLLVSASTPSKNDFLGTWLVQDKDAKVELTINANGTLEGKCVWHKTPNLKDVHNKNPELRDRPVVGMKVVWGFKWNAEDHMWDDGNVYKEGKVYCGKMRLNPDGTIFLKGNICNTPLGKTNVWTRVK